MLPGNKDIVIIVIIIIIIIISCLVDASLRALVVH